jgi:hypothetical protein
MPALLTCECFVALLPLLVGTHWASVLAAAGRRR